MPYRNHLEQKRNAHQWHHRRHYFQFEPGNHRSGLHSNLTFDDNLTVFQEIVVAERISVDISAVIYGVHIAPNGYSNRAGRSGHRKQSGSIVPINNLFMTHLMFIDQNEPTNSLTRLLLPSFNHCLQDKKDGLNWERLFEKLSRSHTFEILTFFEIFLKFF